MTKKISHEKLWLERFEIAAKELDFTPFTGTGGNKRITITGNLYYQFGDLHVETDTYYIVIEIEGAGGVTNLVKYWYMVLEMPGKIDKPIILMHIYKQNSSNDYGSHLLLWDLIWSRMKKEVGARITAKKYTFIHDNELNHIVNDFKNIISNAV